MEKPVFDLVAILIAALIPMILGFIWYNPKVFGKAWMEASGMTDEKVKGGNMGLIMGLSYFLSILLGAAITMAVIHQNGIFSTFEGSGKEMQEAIYGALDANGGAWKDLFRTFKHGALHGTILGFTFALPILATNAMFERKSFKYIAVNGGYWIVCLALMGGFLCQFSGTFM